ncbi:dermonecrotic toxin domain-containing protein [Luteibacter sp.]|uniref:dermonecrotic toxin domain-containing protein n=1 Tax=Luteibacter sp. TaxID=1886636 RepID=UPI002F3F2AA9
MKTIAQGTLIALMAGSVCQASATVAGIMELESGPLARLVPREETAADVPVPEGVERFNQALDDISRVVLEKYPTFSSASKRILTDVMLRESPGLSKNIDVENVYVTTFRENVDGTRDIRSSIPLTDLYREAILHGTVPVFLPDEAGVFVRPGTLAADERVAGLSDRSGILRVEKALETYRDFRFHWRRLVDTFWEERLPVYQNAAEAQAPMRKEWLARMLGALRRLEVDLFVKEGWMDADASALLGRALSKTSLADPARPGVTGIEIVDGASNDKAGPAGAAFVSERPCPAFPTGDCGKVLLLSPGLPTRLFASVGKLNAWLGQTSGDRTIVRARHDIEDMPSWMVTSILERRWENAVWALENLASSDMDVVDATMAIDIHGDLGADVDQAKVIEDYNRRVALDLLMPMAIANGTSGQKTEWRATIGNYLKLLRQTGDELAAGLGKLYDVRAQARTILAGFMKPRGLTVNDPDKVAVVHWTHAGYAGGPPSRSVDPISGILNRIDASGTAWTGRKVTLTDIALENLDFASFLDTSEGFEFFGMDGTPLKGFSFATMYSLVREANVGQRYLDAVNRFEEGVDMNAFALLLASRMTLELVQDAARPASLLSGETKTRILSALANPGIPARLPVHQIMIGIATVGGGVLLFDTGSDGKTAYVLYTPRAPDGVHFRHFGGQDDMAHLVRTDKAFRTYLVSLVVSGERAAAEELLARGGGSDVTIAPIPGNFLVASGRALFAELRNGSRHIAVSTQRRDVLQVADGLRTAGNAMSMLLPLPGLLEAGFNLGDAVRQFVQGDTKGGFLKVGEAGLNIVFDLPPLRFARPIATLGKFARHLRLARTTLGSGGRRMIAPSSRALLLQRPASDDFDAIVRRYEVSGIRTDTMHSPSRGILRESDGQEYVRIDSHVFKSRTVTKPDGTQERIIYNPTNAGDTRVVTFSNETWNVWPAPRLLGGNRFSWSDPRWGEGILKGIQNPGENSSITVDLGGYLTEIKFDLTVCKWRTPFGGGNHLEYDDALRVWKESVPVPGANGAPPLPPRPASDAERIDALRQLGISRAPTAWPRPPRISRNEVPKEITQIWLGDQKALYVRKLDHNGLELPSHIENMSASVARSGLKGYKTTLYVLLDDKRPELLEALRKDLPGVTVVNLETNDMFVEFKASRYFEAFDFFRQAGGNRNLPAAADGLRYFIQYKKGGLYLDTDDRLTDEFTRTRLLAAKDEVLTGPPASNYALGMDAEYNTNAFASHARNPFFIDLLDELVLRFRANRPALTDRPYAVGERSDPGFGKYMTTISRTTGPGLFNDKMRNRFPEATAYANAVGDDVDLQAHEWLINVPFLSSHTDMAGARETYARLTDLVQVGNNHAWRETR